jgi:hypothetical protein
MKQTANFAAERRVFSTAAEAPDMVVRVQASHANINT